MEPTARNCRGAPRFIAVVRLQTDSTMNGSSEKLPTPFDDGEIYDLILKDIPYGLDFYTGLAKEAKGPVLDVCCGTGRILLPCLRAGVDIEGLDLFAAL